MFDISASVLTVFAAYFIALAVLGVWIGRRPRDLGDFALGGRELSPSVTALSHGAVDYSGWLFLAFPGMVYATGIGSATWIGVGLAAGVYVNWRVVAPRLRAYTKRAGDSVTLPGYLENRFEDPTRLLRFASAAVVLVFFTIYVSSGLVAGSLLFEEAFDINSTVAMTVAMAVIVVYTAVGGFRAVSRTHVMQASLMIFALFVLALGGLILLGGFGLFADGLSTKSPALLDFGVGASYADGEWSVGASLGFITVISGLAWGLGYAGQPHILTRYMAIRSVADIPLARRVNMAWVVTVLLSGAIIGLMAVILLDDPLENPETAFFALAHHLSFPLIAGLLMAGVLAAIMSTADSQLLVSATSLTEDFYRAFLNKRASGRSLVWIGRGSVVFVAVVAYALALRGGTVLELVAWAWAGFGAAFGPVVLLSLFWPRMTWVGAMAGIVSGAVVVAAWPFVDPLLGPLETGLYEMVPGWIAATAAAVGLGRSVGKPPQRDWSDEAVNLDVERLERAQEEKAGSDAAEPPALFRTQQ